MFGHCCMSRAEQSAWLRVGVNVYLLIRWERGGGVGAIAI